jgi:hypothetical protein
MSSAPALATEPAPAPPPGSARDKGGSAPVEAHRKSERAWPVPGEVADLVGRVRFGARRGVAATLWLRTTADAEGSPRSGYGFRVEGDRLWLVRRSEGKDHALTEKATLAGTGGKQGRLELVAHALGPWLLGAALDGKTGKELAVVLAKDDGFARGGSVLVMAPAHTSKATPPSVMITAGCTGDAGPVGGDRFLRLSSQVANDLPAALAERVTRLEETAKGTVFRTDARAVEAVHCAGLRLENLSIETPWKYIEGAYLEHRDGPPVKTDTGVRLDLSYKNDAMVAAILRAYHARYPGLTELVTLGKSHQGRPLVGLLVTRNPASSGHKPSVYLNATHHGNEPLSTEFVLDAVHRILSRAGSDPAVDRWLDELRIWCVPMVNPDGTWAFLEDSNRSGRKNGRDHDRDGERGLSEGVDLNRNYPFRWGFLGEKGSRSRAASVYYRGPRAGSEPEAAAMMALAEREHFVVSVSFHIGTVALLAPYTIDRVRDPEPHLAWQVAEELVKNLPPHPDKPMIVKRNLYPVDGTDQDWLAHSFGTLALLVEGGRTSYLERPKRKAALEAVRPIWTRLLDRFLEGPSISGRVLDLEGRPVAAQVEVAEVQTHEGERWMTRCHDGRFDRLLPEAARYTLRVTVPGQPPFEQPIEVSSRGVTEVRLPFAVAPAVCAR